MLKDRVAIVTGSGRGIGRATAEIFARHGARVVVCDRDEEPCREVVQLIQDQGGTAVACIGDVSADEFPVKTVDTAVEAFGAGIDIVVNNAGYGGKGFVEETTDAFWGTMLDLHASAPFRLIRAVVPVMKQSADEEKAAGQTPACRKIINVSSIAGTDGLEASVAYATSKAAVEGLTRTLAKDLGQSNICVNAVAFGLIKTRLSQPTDTNSTTAPGPSTHGFPSRFLDYKVKLTPLARVGTVDEAAGAIFMLASPYANFITGEVIKVSGGL